MLVVPDGRKNILMSWPYPVCIRGSRKRISGDRIMFSHVRLRFTESIMRSPVEENNISCNGGRPGRLPKGTACIAMTDDSKDNDNASDVGVLVRAKTKTRKPSMYKVLMLNDDYTPMEFVVHVLERFFNKTRDEATNIMLHVHKKGVGVCGVFTYEVAESKVTLVMDLARQNQHPLQCTIERD